MALISCSLNIYTESLQASVKIYNSQSDAPETVERAQGNECKFVIILQLKIRSHVSSKRRGGALLWWLSQQFSFPAKQFLFFYFLPHPPNICIHFCICVYLRSLSVSPSEWQPCWRVVYTHTWDKMSQYLPKQELTVTVDSKRMWQRASEER